MGIGMGSSALTACRHNQKLRFFLCYACNAKPRASANVMCPGLQPPPDHDGYTACDVCVYQPCLHLRVSLSQRVYTVSARIGATLMESS